jgi:CHAD domain-containing protein
MAQDLLLGEGVTTDAAIGALSEHLPLREREVTETERTFYDTFDGLLHRAGLAAAHEGARLWVGSADDAAGDGLDGRASAAWASPPRRVLAIELDPGPLRDALEPVVGVRALLALVRVHNRRRAFDLLDDEDKTVVRMVVQEPSVVASERRMIALRPRVRLSAVRGYDSELDRVRKALEREFGFTVAHQPLVDEAVGAAGGPPAGTSSKPEVKLTANQRTDAAAGAVLLALVLVIEANLEGTVADVDAEFLHDFRVAVRRTRAVQRELKGAFPAPELAHFRAEFRWLQRATGDARDLDVYVLEFEAMRSLVPEAFRHDLDPLLGVLRSHRLTARREMVRALRSDRAIGLLAAWPVFLDRLGAGAEAGGPLAAEPIGRVAGARIAKVYRRMVKMGGAIDDSSPPESLHELRKKGKELRYLLELFGAELFPSTVVKPMIKTLKALQDVLGRHQDREVQAATLRSLREEVSALPGGAAALMSMGLLVERVGADQHAARVEFAERFAAFASKSQRRLVKETFG